MDDFEALARRARLTPPIASDGWTLYQGRSEDLLCPGIPRDPADWGMICVYRFDRGIDPAWIARVLELSAAVGALIAKLELPVRRVPYYGIGADYVTQVKPPYDGGYSTDHFGDFVAHGDTPPPPGFARAHAELMERLLEDGARVEAVTAERTRVLREVAHRTFVAPHGELFWDDGSEPPWTLYRPCFGRTDLDAWGEAAGASSTARST